MGEIYTIFGSNCSSYSLQNVLCATFEVLTAVLMKIKVFCGVTAVSIGK